MSVVRLFLKSKENSIAIVQSEEKKSGKRLPVVYLRILFLICKLNNLLNNVIRKKNFPTI